MKILFLKTPPNNHISGIPGHIDHLKQHSLDLESWIHGVILLPWQCPGDCQEARQKEDES